MFLIHIITDKVIILRNKFLGEGRETWLWVCEMAASDSQGAWGDIPPVGNHQGSVKAQLKHQPGFPKAACSCWLAPQQNSYLITGVFA